MFERQCMNCAHTLSFREWGVDRICPHCGKCSVNVDIKEIHVAFAPLLLDDVCFLMEDEGVNHALGRDRKEYYAGVDYLRLQPEYELCIGDISDPPKSNAIVYAHRYRSSHESKLEYQLQQKLSIAQNNASVYLWIRGNDANEVMNLLLFAKEFQRFEHVYLVRWFGLQEDDDASKQSIINALDEKMHLSKQDIDDLYARFLKIQGWRADCLLGNYERIEPWTYQQLEECVLRFITKNYRKNGSIYNDAMEEIRKESTYYFSYHMFEEILHRLMMQGKIESHGACMWWGSNEFNNMICTQKFRLARKNCSHDFCEDDAFYALRYAFEVGYTYPLYPLLDENAVLLKEEEEIRGRWQILEYIEIDGSARINTKKESVTCHIVKVQEGEHYEKGDVYVVVRYEKDEKKDIWLIDVTLGHGRIQKLVISKPKGPVKFVSLDAGEDF